MLKLIKFLFIVQLCIQGVFSLSKEYEIGKNGIRRIFIETDKECNWFKAHVECTRKKMSLIAIDTPEKNILLDEILQKEFGSSCPHLWIGANDLGDEDKFVWLQTGRPFTFAKWKANMPDNFLGKEHCVHLTKEREWNDIKCGFKYGYICEGP
ncbi:lectin subunit alpha-like [Haematobia irritans]|uniref:lectin subunit alpha-like n=1 Tax=Haematobia irritans TaxID=7368 RepID=UPI003F4FB438